MWIEASDEDICRFFAEVDRLVSLKDKDIRFPEKMKNSCLLFDNGDFLCDAEEVFHPDIMSWTEVLQRKGSIRRFYSVDMEVIRLLIQEYDEKQGQGQGQEILAVEALVSSLLNKACCLRVSDIHVKVQKYDAEVLFRINGDMIKVRKVSSSQGHELCSALYNAAESADATYRLYDYQAARVVKGGALRLPAVLQSLRLQYNPLPDGGRYLIARLLYAENKWKTRLSLIDLGFEVEQKKCIDGFKMKPEGVCFVAGPTGSGKSTTLKNILESIYIEREKKVNIISIEDPPEYEIIGAAQLPVTNVETEEERKLAYGKAITAALRSDPDIIMPGEARDAAVIGLVFTAAMTGHQVWTSIHANSALGVFDRLKDQGVEDYKLCDPDLIIGIISQRLLKKLCPKCSKTYDKVDKEPFIEELFSKEMERVRFNNPIGCGECNKGYSGRSVVAEVLRPDRKMLHLINCGDKEKAIDYWRQCLNGITIGEHGWLKVANGEADPFDVISRLGKIERPYQR